MPQGSDTLLLVARIGRLVGVYGGLKLHILSDFPSIFQSGARFHTKLADIPTLRIARYERGVVEFEGFQSRESAARLVNVELFSTLAESQEMCALEKGEFLWQELFGVEVYECADVEASEDSSVDSYLECIESCLDSAKSCTKPMKPRLESASSSADFQSAIFTPRLLGVVKDIERIGELDYFLINTSAPLREQGLAKTFLIPNIPHYIISLSKERILTRHALLLLQES